MTISAANGICFVPRTEFFRSLSVAAFLVAAALAGFPAASATAADQTIVEFRGRTMGTTYMVKLFDPPELDEDIQLAVDAELREVNDQMSTYLESSEVSRFNASESTDWFPVSEETAQVVAYAQQVAEATGGAFDVTVGPLVNAWNFGPGPRTDQPPDQQQIDALRQRVGHHRLAVRRDPPALRKEIPELQIDLSAIAKGHGVDRVVAMLRERGAENVFVEIGGEVRTAGDKAGEPWMVGIQRPDSASDEVMIAHPLVDAAIATSGDYRNTYEWDGVRYSHTIDPRTGAPVADPLASVSVIADRCMEADAWATAISVLGREAGSDVARQRNLDTLIIARTPDGFALDGTGQLSQLAEPDRTAVEEEAAGGAFLEALLPVLLVTAVAFGVLLAAMAVGVIFGRRSISGSCGGLNSVQGGGENCSLCGSSTEGCQELRQKVAEGQQRERAESTTG